MAAPMGTKKICVTCGDDCSSKPRTKDAKGRYYCRECYELAMKPKSDAAPVADHLELLLDSLPSAGPTNTCPQCGGAMTAGSAMCDHCELKAAPTIAVARPKPSTPKKPSDNTAAYMALLKIMLVLIVGGGIVVATVLIRSELKEPEVVIDPDPEPPPRQVAAAPALPRPPAVPTKQYNDRFMSFSYPTTWKLDADALRRDVTVNLIERHASTRFLITSFSGDPKEVTDDFVEQYRENVTVLKENQPFQSWGSFTGNGRELVITHLGQRHRSRVFSTKLPNGTMLHVIETCPLSEVNSLAAEFEQIRSSFTAK